MMIRDEIYVSEIKTLKTLPRENDDETVQFLNNKKQTRVLKLSGGGYFLIDGRQRYETAKALGLKKITVNILDVSRASRALGDEIAEKRREGKLTVRAVYHYASIIRMVEREKVLVSEDDEKVKIHKQKELRNIVAKRMGVYRNLLDRTIYLYNHASSELIRRIDKGEVKINTAYMELKLGNLTKTHMPENQQDTDNQLDIEEIRIVKLEEKALQEYYRANTAEANLRELEEKQKNQIYHRDSIIESLKAQVAELRAQLESMSSYAGSENKYE